MTIERVNPDGFGTGNWRSRLHSSPGDDGCRLFELAIDVHIQPAPAGTYTFEATDGDGDSSEATIKISAWTSADIDTFWTNFRQCIHDGWNNKLWLVHSGALSGCYHGYDQTYENLKCGVTLNRTADQDSAQLRLLMLFRPHQADGGFPYQWRSNCALGGRAWNWFGWDNPIDMRCAGGDTEFIHRDLPASDERGDHRFWQVVAQHEFGHYLGLSHTCASAGVANSNAQYCHGRTVYEQEDMMAAGYQVRPWHATAWLERLPQHDYYTGMDFTWTAVDMEPSPPPAESCPGPRRGLSMGVPVRR